MSEYSKLFTERVRNEYKKIKYVECPAFQNEKVFFNDKGFHHLIRKGRVPRSNSDKIRRLHLFRYASNIIKSADKFEKYSSIGKTHFWSICRSEVNDGELIIVIIQQIEGEPRIFLVS